MRLLKQETIRFVMKNTLFRFAGVAGLASGMLFAQTPAPPSQPQPPAQHRHGHRGQMLDRMATRLNLTAAQKQQAQSILQSAHEFSKPLAQQLRENRQALREAIKAGKPDADIEQLSTNAGNLAGQMTAIRTKSFAKIYALLTPEQRTKADQLGGHTRGMFMGGHERGHGGGAGS
jgi:Spy/CpxP family protein refolding chaperone